MGQSLAETIRRMLFEARHPWSNGCPANDFDIYFDISYKHESP